MPAAGRVGVRKFVDQHDLGAARDDGVKIHFLKPLAAVFNTPARNNLQAVQKGFGLLAAVGLHDPDDHVVAVLVAGTRGLQHRVSLADSRRGADEDPELAGATVFAPGGLEQSFRRGPLVALLICHRQLCAAAAPTSWGFRTGTGAYLAPSRAMFSASTLTRGSPRRPSRRPSTWALTSSRTRSSGKLRAFATRGTWNIAASGVMCGSSPPPVVVTKSIGTGAEEFSAFSLSTSALTRSIRALLVGPRLAPPEFAALYGAGTVLLESLGSGAVVADGRPWKYLSLVNSWPISAEPTTLPSTSTRLPCACFGKMTPASPVITSG